VVHAHLFFLSRAKPASERMARLLPIPRAGWVSAAQKSMNCCQQLTL
jgi:hypothetical protein